MMKIARIGFLLSVLMILALTGCKTSEEDGTGDERTPFVGGENAIDLAFLEGSPPGEVFDGGEFPFEVTVKLQNEGEYDIPIGEAKIDLLGIDPGEFGLGAIPSWTNTETIYGVKKDSEGNIIPGAIIYADFGTFNYARNLSGNVEYSLRADVCYQYSSQAIAKLCYLEDVLHLEETPLCEVNGRKTVWNAGSPIHVTSIEQSAMGNNKISFSFKIQHREAGAISKRGTDCDLTYVNKDKVFVTVNTGVLNTITCNGLTGSDSGAASGEITLYSGERSILCIQDIDTTIGGEYEKLVTITTDYDYKDHTSADILIKHVIT